MDLNQENLIASLEAAGNASDGTGRKISEEQLKAWSNSPGFHVMLQDVYLNQSYGLQPRWLAIIYLKNSISGHWRRTSSHPVSHEEKKLVRSRAFKCINEPNRKLNAQNAAAMAKMARVDFPREWPEVFDQFNSEVLDVYYSPAQYSQDQLLGLYNGLEMLNQLLKTLATAKYGSVLAALKQRAPLLISKIGQIYFSTVNQWMQDFDLAKMEVGYKALKVTSRLIYDGVDRANHNADTTQFFVTIKEHLVGFMQAFDSNPSDLLAKHIKQIGKFFIRFRRESPVAFMLMPTSIDVFHLYLQAIESKARFLTVRDEDDEDDENLQLWEKVVIQGFILLSDQVQLLRKKGVSLKSRTEDDRKEVAECMRKISDDLFTQNVVYQLLNLLLNNYLRITGPELASWHDDPEAFYVEETGQERWQFQVRPCAVRLFIFILPTFPDLADQVMPFVENALSQNDDSGLQDCALQALEHSASILSTKVDLNHMMVQLMALKTNKSNVVVRRRLCLIIAEWTSLDLLTPEVKVQVYNTLVNDYISATNSDDVVVMLSAAQALRYSVDDWKFEPQLFASFIDAAFSGLFTLMARLSTIDCKVTVLQVLSVLIEQLGTHIAPYSESVIKMLPPLWEEAGDKYYIKGLVLQTLASVVKALGSNSPACYGLAIPALSASCDPKSPEYAYLLEDGLPLWDALLDNATEASLELLSLLDLLLSCMSEPSENLHMQLEIMSKYIAWAGDCQPRGFSIADLASKLFAIFKSYLPYLKSDMLMAVVGLLEMITEWFPVDQYGDQLTGFGLLNTLVQQLLSPSVGVLLSLRIFNVLARMCIHNARVIWSLVGDDRTREGLVDEWLEKYHNIGHPKDRKLTCLGLTAVLSTADPVVINRFPKFIDMWCDLLDEVNDDSAGDSSVYYTNEELSAEEDAQMTAYSARMIRMRKTLDPIHVVQLKPTIKSTISLDSLQPVINSLPDDLLQLLKSLLQ